MALALPRASAASSKQAEVDADSLICLGCPAIAAYERFARRTGSRGDESVIGCATIDAELDKAGDEGTILVSGEHDIRFGESSGKEVPHKGRCHAMRWR
jgi:hypothetical protein